MDTLATPCGMDIWNYYRPYQLTEMYTGKLKLILRYGNYTCLYRHLSTLVTFGCQDVKKKNHFNFHFPS